MLTSDRHPEYTSEILLEWELMRDAWRGESAIKKRGQRYLRPLDGWAERSDGGLAKYSKFIYNARFPEIVSSAIRGMVGIAHQQEWQMDMPNALMPLWENSDGKGLPLEALSKRITMELLITGRYGLLADAPPEGGDIYRAGYRAEDIINWSDDDDFYALEETIRERTGETWFNVKRRRVLELVEGRYVQRIYDDGALIAEYQPRARGGAALDMIPLTIGGAMDLDLTPDTPPLIGVARAAVASYQLNALYRNALELGVSSTLVGIDIQTPPTAIGPGVYIDIKSSDVNKSADLKYVTPEGLEIDALVTAMDREKAAAVQSGAQLFDNTPRTQESGEARRLRFSAETATLASIVGASALILERTLKQAAIMTGADPDEVVIQPPQNLLEGRLDPQEMLALRQLWDGGALSYQTLYENLQRGRVASPERDYEAELALIASEGPSLSETGGDGIV